MVLKKVHVFLPPDHIDRLVEIARSRDPGGVLSRSAVIRTAVSSYLIAYEAAREARRRPPQGDDGSYLLVEASDPVALSIRGKFCVRCAAVIQENEKYWNGQTAICGPCHKADVTDPTSAEDPPTVRMVIRNGKSRSADEARRLIEASAKKVRLEELEARLKGVREKAAKPRKKAQGRKIPKVTIPTELEGIISQDDFAARVQSCSVTKKAETWRRELDRLVDVMSSDERIEPWIISDLWQDAIASRWQGCTPDMARDKASRVARQTAPRSGDPLANVVYDTEEPLECPEKAELRKAMWDAELEHGEGSEEHQAAQVAIVMFKEEKKG